MKTDYFAEFRRQRAENAGYKGYGETNPEKMRELTHFQVASPVTGVSGGQVAPVTSPDSQPENVTAFNSMTGVTPPVEVKVTNIERDKTKQNPCISDRVTRVTPVTQQNNSNTENATITPRLAHVHSVIPDSRSPLISREVRAKIEAIEAAARAKDWPAELLWNAGFWDAPRGLAAVLSRGDEIVEVTPDYIKILRCRRDILTFPRYIA
jgi:hypothetical protein